MGNKVVAVVQARMGSTRLPNKMMLWLNGYPVIEWVRRRLERCEKLDDVVFTIPNTPDNDPLHHYLASYPQRVFRGPEDDVLHRVSRAAFDATHVVRVCGDCPLISWKAIDDLVRRFLMIDADYMYNHVPKSNLWPDGLGAEIVTRGILDQVVFWVRDDGEREHIFNYIWNHPERFRMCTFSPYDLMLHHPELKLDLDTYEDYQRLLASGVDINMTAEEIVECFL